MRHCVPWMVAGVLLAGASAVMAEATNDEEAAYTRSITERADKIVAPLAIDDAAKASRVRGLVVEQYRALRNIHAERDARLAQMQGQPSDPTVAQAWRNATQKEVDLKLFALHRGFLAQLAAELPPEKVDQVKDGMTYGVVPITYKRYRELLPELTVEQQADILAMLLEAREYAMDGGSADEKHAIFGKYKGRINNYLSAAGYNMKQAEQDWAARQKAAGSSQ